MKIKNKKLIIKVGTNVITRDNGWLDLKSMRQIVEQIVKLKKSGWEIILVTSGAVGAGKSLVNLAKNTDKVSRRQVLAAVGQVKLMETYAKLFGKHKLHCAQVLATKSDFGDRGHYLNMKNCFAALLRDEIVPVVNENDVVSVEELMFTDNDELAGLIAAMMSADKLILLTSVDGILKADQKVAAEVGDIAEVIGCVLPTKSKFGRGGMHTKCRVADKLSGLGIHTHIVNGRKKNIILDVVKGKKVGTTFLPDAKQVSEVKKWIAYTDAQQKGKVVIDDGAVKVLTALDSAHSLLPVGIKDLSGDFHKGDVIQICDQSGQVIGCGLAQYDSAVAKKYLGKKGKPELIHYDYLYLNI